MLIFCQYDERNNYILPCNPKLNSYPKMSTGRLILTTTVDHLSALNYQCRVLFCEL